MRRFGKPPKTDVPYVRRPGAYVVALHRGKVLLTHQAQPYPEFQLPGGGIDPGESAVQALRRECLEETGWSLTGIKQIGIFRRYVFMPEYDIMAEKLCHIFRAKAIMSIARPSEPGHTAVLTDPQTALHAIANSGDAHYLARVTGQIPRIEFQQRR